jgi:hypothetical protein
MARLADDKDPRTAYQPASEAAAMKGQPALPSVGSRLARLAGIGVAILSLVAAFLYLGASRPSFAAGPNTPRATDSVAGPTPGQLWQRIEALRQANSFMLGSHAGQLGSRTVDWYTMDFANQPVNDAIRRSGGITKVTTYPAQSLMVKVNYTREKKLTGITAMLKVPNYDAGDRNWLMASYSPSGQVRAFGKVGACIGCHAMVASADFNFAPPPAQLLSPPIWKAFFPNDTMSSAYLELLKEHPAAVVR